MVTYIIVVTKTYLYRNFQRPNSSPEQFVGELLQIL